MQTSVLLCVSPVPKIFSSLRAVPEKIHGWWRESIQMDIEVCARFEQFLNVLSRGGIFLRTLTRPKERKKIEKKIALKAYDHIRAIMRRALAVARRVIFSRR